jgi:hypothetical protein
MTPYAILAERRVIIATRLGILCEDQEPTPEQMAIAAREADEWEALQTTQQID